MAKNKTPIEVKRWLEHFDVGVLGHLAAIVNNPKEFEALIKVINVIHNSDKDIIIRSAGGVTSLDTMIKSNTNQTFYRGRIAFATLLHSVLVNAGREYDKKMEARPKKK